ncbi:MAG: peptidase dimerization domain-containing protein [Kiritimatiellae bacterium]|nr:peptidase dimerization domain-containing protein [Kiritimatiellia bacterium]
MGLGADEALILEPTELAIVHAHKGTLWYEVELKGQAAHGSNPQHGLSAVRAMVEVIGDIEREAERAREQRDHPLLGPPTVNIGVIRGGSSINIVPDRCVIEVDRRTVPGEDHRDILDRIRVGLMRLQSLKKIAGYEVKKLHEGLPSPRLQTRGSCSGSSAPAVRTAFRRRQKGPVGSAMQGRFRRPAAKSPYSGPAASAKRTRRTNISRSPAFRKVQNSCTNSSATLRTK